MTERVVLEGGVANAGAVVREGEHVLRPVTRQTPAVHALLRHLRSRDFHGAPNPVGIDADGRERLGFIPGDVPIPPYPAWSRTDRALASVASLLARFHQAAADFDWPSGTPWNDELADPIGGSAVCHNDVCLENVVFRDGVAVALLDFDFAAPGRPIHDLAALARMCVPLTTPGAATAPAPDAFDPFRRLRLVADSYGLPAGREPFVEAIEASMRQGNAFVHRRVERGELAFVEMLEHHGGQHSFDRRWDWFAQNRSRFVEALD